MTSGGDSGGRKPFWAMFGAGRARRAGSEAVSPAPAAEPAFMLFGGAGPYGQKLAAEATVPDVAVPAPAEGGPEKAPEQAPELPPERAPAQANPTLEASAFLAPRDLELTQAAPAHILAIGSCFLEDLMGPHHGERAAFETDFVLVNGVEEFPEAPPRPMAEYGFQVVQIPLRFVMGDRTFSYLNYADQAGFEAAFEHCATRLQTQLDRRMTWNRAHGSLTFVLNFMTPQFNPMGRLFPRFDLRNMEYFVLMLNQALERLVSGYANAFILDGDRIAASLGRRFIQDDIMTAANHNARLPSGLRAADRLEDCGPLGETYTVAPEYEFRLALMAELRAMYRTARQTDSVKLVVVDLDDTLWQGVSGDTADIGPHMVEFWPIGLVEALHWLRKRGLLLAIISKNDEARIRAIWRSIFHDRLSLDDFAAVRIAWSAKAGAMQEILQAMSLLPGNVVFIDDNPAERAQMQAAFPAMRMLGSNPFVLRRVLLLSPETQVVTVTPESARRTDMVQAQLLRETERRVLPPEDFAQAQGVKVRLSPLHSDSEARFARAFELVNKTNQFNTTGRRWTPEACRAFFAEGGFFLIYDVEDRYTPYGLVGVVIVTGDVVGQWVMSCRVIGLGAERAVMAALVRSLRAAGIGAIRAPLTQTEVNRPCHSLFADAGFAERDGIWVLDAATAPDPPPHISVEAG